MKIRMIAMMVGVGLLVAGCATKSSYVGTWYTDENLPDEDLKSITVYITEQGSCSILAETKNGSEGGNATWTTNSVGGIDISIEDGDTATGQLLDKSTLFISGDGDAVKLSRQ